MILCLYFYFAGVGTDASCFRVVSLLLYIWPNVLDFLTFSLKWYAILCPFIINKYRFYRSYNFFFRYLFYENIPFFTIFLQKNLVREIHHFWYTCWPSNETPEPISVVKFVLDTRPYYEDSGAPVIVHCR